MTYAKNHMQIKRDEKIASESNIPRWATGFEIHDSQIKSSKTVARNANQNKVLTTK